MNANPASINLHLRGVYFSSTLSLFPLSTPEKIHGEGSSPWFIFLLMISKCLIWSWNLPPRGDFNDSKPTRPTASISISIASDCSKSQRTPYLTVRVKWSRWHVIPIKLEVKEMLQWKKWIIHGSSLNASRVAPSRNYDTSKRVQISCVFSTIKCCHQL